MPIITDVAKRKASFRFGIKDDIKSITTQSALHNPPPESLFVLIVITTFRLSASYAWKNISAAHFAAAICTH